MSNDVLIFLRSWVSEPLRVGAIAPSGGALADLITREITPATGPVIELGPGTGAFTKRLLKRGVRAEDLTLVEYGSEFATLLQLRYPGVRVLRQDAARLSGSRHFKDVKPAGAVVSGLPLVGMSMRKIMSILGGAFTHMRPDGAFYQFTYSMRCPVPPAILDRLGLEAKLVDRIILNVPPAAVYRITRRAANQEVA
ncbi:rRNA adenine N-6-methyltransferase family protein [Hyphomicrobium sp. LHD-15]|uniref:class I SAM-dependent methyltransferase n=1 Tax=Hyphomicrobium sp. LHD-15 TaxID=3072142 RepID=UPI00280CCD3F|nr:rRNA adenine N-6-methyltransferase family protein [Hyphomicrobium sp. LHD-15]MDQ8700205.1 SAM-dependent methyltransferase [Hyphomicrobium sp. LHD-15]